MKIVKLYTLSQFIDYVKEMDFIDSEFKTDSIDDMNTKKLVFIYRYSEFLKQPLKKEMFVNEIEKPDREDGCYMDYNHNNCFFDSEEFDKDMIEWVEAEKNVIFEDVGLIGNVIICKEENLFINESCRYDSLQELAEKTNGQLELKNLET